MTSKLILFIVLQLLLGAALADLPVRCLPTQFRHEWDFAMVPFPLSEKVTPDTLKFKCTKQYLSENRDRATFLRMKVMQPNRVTVDSVSKPESPVEDAPEIKIRTRDVFDMTMMSDQGFEIINSKYSLFTFFSYILQPKGYIKSECDRTQVGWFSSAEKDVFGCFIAYKEEPEDGDVIVHRPVSDMIKREDNIHLDDDMDEDEDADLDFSARPFRPDAKRVKEINTLQNGWEAFAYPHYKKFTNKQLQTRMGSPLRSHSLDAFRTHLHQHAEKRHAEVEEDDDASLLAADGSETFLSRKRAEFKALPARFDWRSVDGQSYVSPVRDQGICGSCYAMATLDALEARVRVQNKNANKYDLAVQDVLSCSPYSQQCNGGYPFAVARYASDFGVVTEECMRYKAENGTCTSKCAEPNVIVRVSEYDYIGGFLGAGNAEDMMFEIYKNGPIVASFMVHDDFKYYKKGVYSHVSGKAGKKGVVNPIEVTSHSVCIIGWDEDEVTGEKSWIVKNSWGKDFGEEAPKNTQFWKDNCSDGKYCGGFFRIRRGVDESAIESAAVSFIPKVIQN